MPSTIGPWQQIASLGKGNYFQVEQAGSAVAYTTPFDEEIATLSAQLDDTRLYYENRRRKEPHGMRKFAAADKLEVMASVSSKARRRAFSMSRMVGKRNMLGEKELVDCSCIGRSEAG